MNAQRSLGNAGREKVLRILNNINAQSLAELNSMALHIGLAKPADDAQTVIRRMRRYIENIRINEEDIQDLILGCAKCGTPDPRPPTQVGGPGSCVCGSIVWCAVPNQNNIS